VQPYWPGLFASLLSNRINDLLYSVGGGGGGGGVSSAAASALSAPAGDGMLCTALSIDLLSITHLTVKHPLCITYYHLDFLINSSTLQSPIKFTHRNYSCSAKAAEKPKEEKPKEEVVDALDGGMDMFGGGGGGGGDY